MNETMKYAVPLLTSLLLAPLAVLHAADAAVGEGRWRPRGCPATESTRTLNCKNSN